MWKFVSMAAKFVYEVLRFIILTPLYLVQWGWGYLFEGRASTLKINDFTPKYAKVGRQVTIKGIGLQSATITFGGKTATIKSKSSGQLVVLVPKNNPGEYSIVAEAGGKKSTAPGKFRVLSSDAFTFRGGLITHGASILNSITPSSLNQKYLILMARTPNIALPAGATAASLKANLQTMLTEANKFWLEASYGKTSFTFDIPETILELAKDSKEYNLSRQKTIDGVGATYPVNFTGGETLIVSGDSGFAATVTFTGGSKDLFTVVAEINAAFTAVTPTPEVVAGVLDNQLRLQTRSPGAAAILDLDAASTALTLLGLNPGVIIPGTDDNDDRWGLVKDALTKNVEGLTDDDAATFLSGYSGVMVSLVTNDLLLNWPRADTSQIDVRGRSYELSFVVMVNGITWQCIAHEIGHNLGFPDLYDASGTWAGTEPGQWDIMDCSWEDVHPCTWIKNYKTLDPKDASKVWLPSSEIEDLPKGTDTASSSVEVLLAPIESPLPATNPFSVTHPGLKLRHAIRIKIDENRTLFVENRQPGPYNHAKLGTAKYSTQLQVAAGGIIVTDTINKFPATAARSNVIMASPFDDSGGDFPDVNNEEVTVFKINATAGIKVKITEVIGTGPIVYKVKATWEQGKWVDPYIMPWGDPPYETPDIWVDTEIDNKFDEYLHTDAAQNPEVKGNPVDNGDRLRKNFPARLYARIRNSGKTDANGVAVKFTKVVPPGIGPAPEEEIDQRTINVPGNGFALAQVDWTPKTEDEAHACIKVTVDSFTGELNAENNVAQENFTDWYVEAASPFEPVGFVYQMVNPLPHRALVRMEARGLKPGWSLDVDPLEAWLNPGQKILGFAGINAEQSVPFEDKDKVNGRPRISLVGRVKMGCRMVPFGGISGYAHAVRKSEITGKVSFPDSKTANISANAKTKDGPVDNTNVTLIFMGPGGKQLLMTRVNTNSNGLINVKFPKPDGFSSGTEFMVDLLLSPSLGRGAAETRLKFKFPVIKPVASFSAFPEVGVAPLTVQFSDNSSGEITGRNWTFGDGGSGTGTDPTHMYKSDGQFTVTLTVSGPDGSSTQQKTIVVNPEDPVGGGGNDF